MITYLEVAYWLLTQGWHTDYLFRDGILITYPGMAYWLLPQGWHTDYLLRDGIPITYSGMVYWLLTNRWYTDYLLRDGIVITYKEMIYRLLTQGWYHLIYFYVVSNAWEDFPFHYAMIHAMLFLACLLGDHWVEGPVLGLRL
jgi:hypothetical protein